MKDNGLGTVEKKRLISIMSKPISIVVVVVVVVQKSLFQKCLVQKNLGQQILIQKNFGTKIDFNIVFNIEL